MSTQTPARALIVGAGIAGLATALAFQHRGWDVQVVERAEALREIGAGIQLSPNGMKIMRALGLEDAVLQRGFLPEALEMRMGRSGFPIFRLPIKSASHYRWRAPYVHIHRADLIDILSQALHQRAPGCVRLGTMVQGLFEDGAGVVCQDGERLSADVVIAADGLRSTLRSAAFGPQPARYTGMTAWRATVPLAALGGSAPPPTACVWAGPGRHAVSYLLARGQVANFVGVVEKDIPNPEALETWRSVSGTAPQIAEALEDFAGWDPTITRMIQASQGLSQWALFDRPPSTQWIRGRMALVGDAAHPMLPTFAQGASQGLEDAWTVATLVDRADHVEDGLRRYASLRQPRTRAIQQRAMQNARDFHHQPGLEQIRAYSTLFFGGRFLPWLARGRLDEIYRYDAVAEAESAAKV